MYWIKKNSLRFLVNQPFFNMLSPKPLEIILAKILPLIIIKVRRRVTAPAYCAISCSF
jgi:hypothetical protein